MMATARPGRVGLSLRTADVATDRLRAILSLTLSSRPNRAGLTEQYDDEEPAEHTFILRLACCARQEGIGTGGFITQFHPQPDIEKDFANVAETPHVADWQLGVYLSVRALVTASRWGTSGFPLRFHLI